MINASRKISKLILAAGSLACMPIVLGQTGTSVNEGDWPNIHGEISSQRYSPLDQINTENVADLEIAWRFSTKSFGPATDYVNPSTPIEVDGILYANVASTRNVVALDAITGQILWL